MHRVFDSFVKYSTALAPRRRTLRRAARRGTAAVEFAVVAPLLFLVIVLPTFEFSRGLMVAELATNAARSGCRVGILPGNSNSTIASAVDTSLTSQGVKGATTTIKVNGAAADVSAAVPGEQNTVTATFPH